MLGFEREMLDAVEVPYRIIDVAAGDLGTSAELGYTSALAVDQYGNVFIADNTNYVIRRVDGATGVITAVYVTRLKGKLGPAPIPAAIKKKLK